jgi:hypothetical protein
MPNEHFRRCDGHHEMIDSGPGKLGGDWRFIFLLFAGLQARRSATEMLAASPTALYGRSCTVIRRRQQYKGHDEHAAGRGADSGFHSPVHAVVGAGGGRRVAFEGISFTFWTADPLHSA